MHAVLQVSVNYSISYMYMLRAVVHVHVHNSAFTLPTSELCQTGLVPFSKADISRTTGTWQVPVVLLISAFENQSGTVLKLVV